MSSSCREFTTPGRVQPSSQCTGTADAAPHSARLGPHSRRLTPQAMSSRGERGPSTSGVPSARQHASHSAAQEAPDSAAMTPGQPGLLCLPTPVTAEAEGMPQSFLKRAFGEAAPGEADAWQEWLDAKQSLAVDVLQVRRSCHCPRLSSSCTVCSICVV